jgi:hypothetical protein
MSQQIVHALALPSAVENGHVLSGVRALDCFTCGRTFENAAKLRDHLFEIGVKPDDYGSFFEYARRANAGKSQPVSTLERSANKP